MHDFAAVLAQQIQTQSSFSVFSGALLCGFGLVGLAMFAFWVWSLVNAIKNPKLDSNMRLIWVLVIVLVGPLGSLIYLLAGR